jgi:hypothetical protein
VVRVAPGVYTVAGSPATWQQRLTVGLLALGEDSWVSHEAAARLHGLDRAPKDAVEFTVAREGAGGPCRSSCTPAATCRGSTG